MKRLTLGVLAIAGAISSCVPVIPAVHAHDHGEGAWINNQRLTDPVTGVWCCDLQDCREETANVEPVDGGYRIKDTGEVIPRERVIWRSPGGWWRCRHLSGPDVGKTRCLIGPPQGS